MKKPASVPPPVADPAFFSTQVAQARRFYLNLKPARSTALAVLCGGVERSAPGYTIQRADFPYLAIEYVTQGEGTLRLRGGEHRLLPGTVFAYGPSVPHHITPDPGVALVKYFADFTGTEAAALLAEGRLRPGTVARVFPPAEVQPLFDELIRTGRRGTALAPAVCIQLLRSLVLKMAEARAPRPGRDTLALTTYRQCREQLERNFLRLRSVRELAAACHVDGAYLSRLFQRFDHEPPHRVLVRLKMNHAAERLQSPGVLVKQVAEETGYANPFHFSRVFKSVFGVPPAGLVRLR